VAIRSALRVAREAVVSGMLEAMRPSAEEGQAVAEAPGRGD